MPVVYKKKYYYSSRTHLPTVLREHHNAILSLIWGTLAEAARALIKAKVSSLDEVGSSNRFCEIYQLLYGYFGDSLSSLPLGKVKKSRRIKTLPEKDIVGKLKIKGLPGRQAQKRIPSGLKTPEPSSTSEEKLLQSTRNFNYLADMGVPTDIFEAVSYTHLTLPTTPYV